MPRQRVKVHLYIVIYSLKKVSIFATVEGKDMVSVLTSDSIPVPNMTETKHRERIPISPNMFLK